MVRIKTLNLFFFVLLLIVANAAQSAPKLISLSDFFRNPETENCQISPDGKWISCLRSYQQRLNIFVREIASNKEHRLTSETARPVKDYYWSANSKAILYRKDHLGDEKYHLFVVPLKENATSRDLTPFEGISVNKIISIPAGSSEVLFTMNKRNPRLMDAHWVNIETGSVREAAENAGHFNGYLDDLAHKVRIAYGWTTNGETEILTRASEQDQWRVVKKYPADDTIEPLAFHSDGKRVYIKSSFGRDLAALALMDLATGKEILLHQDPGNESDLVSAMFDKRTHEPLAVVYEGDKRRMYGLNSATRADVAAISRHQPSFIVTTTSEDQSKWMIETVSPTDPGQNFIYIRKTSKLELVAQSRPWLKRSELAEMNPLSFVAKDGFKIRGYLTLPRNVSAQNLPLVLFVHGGPWARDHWWFNPDVQLLANRGYAVLQVNFRGSTGYGKKFTNAAKKEFAAAMHRDLIDGVNFVVSKKIADPKRVAIYGASYGGYAALVGLTFTPDVFACGIDYAGPASLITTIEAFPPYWKPLLSRFFYPFVGNPSDRADREDMKNRSPLNFVERIKAPLLIYQGANDPRITRQEADAIAKAVHKRGLPVHYLLAKDEGHGLDNPENAMAISRAMEKFLASCLGGRAEEKVEPAIEARIRELTVDLKTLATP